jgi:hypothetical protein
MTPEEKPKSPEILVVASVVVGLVLQFLIANPLFVRGWQGQKAHQRLSAELQAGRCSLWRVGCNLFSLRNQ